MNEHRGTQESSLSRVSIRRESNSGVSNGGVHVSRSGGKTRAVNQKGEKAPPRGLGRNSSW